jgi:hypothetical protein
MTRARTTGRRGGRSVQTEAAFVRACAALVLASLVALIAACGPSTSTASPSGPGTSASAASPASPASPGPAGSGAALPTPWPANSVLGIEALGAADGQIGAAVTDISRAIADENLSLLREAAAGLAGLDALLPNMARIRQNPAMLSFADRYEAAITKIDAEATKLRDAIDAGDGPAITAATQGLLAGMADYTALQPELADWVRQMPEQKRLLVL